MKIKLKKKPEEKIELKTGDTITATNSLGTWAYMVIEDLRNEKDGCYALTILSAPFGQSDFVGKYTIDGYTLEYPYNAANDPNDLIESLKGNGFTNIKKTEFALTEN